MIRRIVFVWFAIAVICTAVTFFTTNDFDNKWLGVVSTLFLAMCALPVLFLLTLVYHRFLRANKGDEEGITSFEDNPKSNG